MTYPLSYYPPNFDLVAISLYDESGNMLRPWAEAGYNCYCIDTLNDNRSEQVGLGWLHFVNADMKHVETHENILRLKPKFIASFPPCTDLTNAGSRHWAGKLAANPELWLEALDLVLIVEELADQIGCPWFVENPKGKLSTLWRKPNYKFDPWEYGGYLPENDVHPRWPEYIPPRDAYPKGTHIWSGNWFLMPPRKPVADVANDYPGWKKLGGKSAKTKQIRAETPRGFARAVFEKNAVWHLQGGAG